MAASLMSVTSGHGLYSDAAISLSNFQRRSMVLDQVYAGWNRGSGVVTRGLSMRPGLPLEADIDSVRLSAELIASQNFGPQDCDIAAWVLQRVLPSTSQSQLARNLPVPVKQPEVVAFFAGFSLAIVDSLAQWDTARTWLSRAEEVALSYSGLCPVTEQPGPARALLTHVADLIEVDAPTELSDVLGYLSSFTGSSVFLFDGHMRELSVLVLSCQRGFESHSTLKVVAFYILTFSSRQHGLVIQRLIREMCEYPLARSVDIFEFVSRSLCMDNSSLYVQIYTRMHYRWMEVYSAFRGLVPRAHEMAVQARRLHDQYHGLVVSVSLPVCSVISCHHPGGNEWQIAHRSQKEEVKAVFSHVFSGLPSTHHLPACLLIISEMESVDCDVLWQIRPLVAHFPACELEVMSDVVDFHMNVVWQDAGSGDSGLASRRGRMLQRLQDLADCRRAAPAASTGA